MRPSGIGAAAGCSSRAGSRGRSSACGSSPCLQLVPLPQALHQLLAPGSAAVWHPDVTAAAAVLGPGPHPISLYPEATRRWLAFATGVVALALAAAPALRERRLQLRASIAIVAGAVLVSAYGFVARLAFGDKLFGRWSVPTIAPFGPFVSKNHFAGYVELAALLALGLAVGLADEARKSEAWLSWIDSRRSKWVVFAWGAALVLLLAVPVSLSRGGVVSLSAGLTCFVLLRAWAGKDSRLSAPRLIGATAALGLAGLLFVAALPTEARDRVLTLTGITSDQSGSYRLGLWRDTVRLASSSPAVGSGFGAYEDALPRFKTAAGGFRVQHAESDHLELLAEGGLLAALLGAIAVLALVLLGLKALRATEHRLARSLLAAALAGLCAIYVHSAFDFNLRIPSNALMASFVAAVCVSALFPAAAPLDSPRPKRPVPCRPLPRRRLPAHRPRHALERAPLGPGLADARHGFDARRPPPLDPRVRRHRPPAPAPRPSGGLDRPRVAALRAFARGRIGSGALGVVPRPEARGAGAGLRAASRSPRARRASRAASRSPASPGPAGSPRPRTRRRGANPRRPHG